VELRAIGVSLMASLRKMRNGVARRMIFFAINVLSFGG
jgi:hypothetical protein